jgi:hypothetical protein
MSNKKRNKRKPKGQSHKSQAAGNRELSPKILASVAALVDGIRRSSSLAQMASAALLGVRKLGVVVLREILHERDRPFRQRKVTVLCPKCQHVAHKRGKKLHEKKRYTLFGKVPYNRCQYECSECGEHFFPLDAMPVP